MKRILLLLSCTLGLLASAAPISQQQALRLAQKYLHQQRTVLSTTPQQEKLVLTYACKSPAARGVHANDAVYYVFNRGTANGFIVVAGDDRMQRPILAHTDQGSFTQSDLNPALRWWFGAIEHTIAEVMAQPEPQRPIAKIATPGNFASAVAPLVTAKWDQGAPYNDKCPLDEGKRSLVGCTAVAMGQIFHKWKSPVKPSGDNISYVTYSKKIKVEADMRSFIFDWDNMLDSYDENATPEQRNAVADLLYACGLAVEMDYTNEGSGAWPTPSRLEHYFNLDKSCTFTERIFFTSSEWETILKNELNASRPFIYVARAANPNSGHAFVCDGYNSQGLYHINWGWNGHANGYFEIDAINYTQSTPGDPNGIDGGYNYDQSIIYGIHPVGLQNDNSVDTEQRLYFTDINIKNQTYNKRDILRIQLTNVRSDGNAFFGKMGIGYHDGKEYRVLPQEETLDLNDQGGYFPEFDIHVDFSRLKDGEYQLIPICQAKGGQIKPMRHQISGNYRTEIPIRVKGDEVTVIDNSKDYQIQLEVPNIELVSDTAYAGYDCVWNVTVKNPSANTYMGPILIGQKTETGEYAICAQNLFIIEPGETKVIPFQFKSPTGVDSASFAVLGENNEILKEHTYVLRQPVVGIPKFTAEKAAIDLGEKVVYAGDSLTFTMTLYNEGGMYNKPITFWVYKYPYTNFDILKVFSTQSLIINGNTSKTFTTSVDMSDLPAGTYYMGPTYEAEDAFPEWIYPNMTTQPIISIVDIAKTGNFVRVKSADNDNYLTLTSPSASGFTPATLSATDNNSLFYYDHQQLLGYSNGYYLNQQDGQTGATGIQSNGIQFRLSQQEPAQENVFHLLVGDGQYLSANAKVVDQSSAGKFVMEKVNSLPLTVPATGYASLYAPVALEIPSGVEAFVGTCAGQYFCLSPIEQVIPANTAVILTAKEGTYDFPITAAAGKEYVNELEGILATQSIPSALTLQYKDAAGLYVAPENTLCGFQAYLSQEKSKGATALPFQEEDTTGIENLEPSTETQVFYDLNGRLVLYPTHGVYITGEGKKIFVK